MTIALDTTATEHTIRRLTVPLGLPYDAAVAEFERVVPAIEPQRFQALETWEENLTLADEVAPLGLMRFVGLDVQELMRTSNTHRHGTEYLAGNHTIAEQMYRHEPAAMLYAPLRLFLYADDNGQGTLVFDQPSTLFGSLGANPEVAAVGRGLDRKLADALTAMGVQAPGALL